ncbi:MULTISPECIES: Holliday junction resolvase RuvX [unclassified Nitrosospira]|uniref:Holliday junction resolvase RuvX n=1 Tax=unclassified Nitrosospira TaxID=2609267 RepID=UPI000D2FDF74|nr:MULTISPECIES: Holliday junction resolvase RuvX [unclassified Nitrosospira]PTR15221.1 putative Holliday junction resolvase [Nitrosospira sp. Nsp2]WON72727.1 Holliday junction resolvase RuvX [Nitrosospira sp. Is2]
MRDQAEQLPPVPNETGAFRRAGMILAFDFGVKRIGTAVGNLELSLAHPLSTIGNESKRACFAGIAQLIEEWQPVLLVVGLPTYPDGGEHELTRRSRRFAQRLERRYGIETLLVDERYTSTSASNALREAGVNGIKQKRVMDQVAAQLILQTYFDNRDAAT